MGSTRPFLSDPPAIQSTLPKDLSLTNHANSIEFMLPDNPTQSTMTDIGILPIISREDKKAKSVSLGYALETLEQATDYGERFRLYKEHIKGLLHMHRAEYYEGLSQRLLSANKTLSSIAAIHKNFLDCLTESDYVSMSLTKASFTARVQYKSISELNICYLAAEKKKDNHRICLKCTWGEGWEARFGGLLPDDPNKGLLWRLARFADSAVHLTAYFNQAAQPHLSDTIAQATAVDRESPAGHNEDKAAGYDEGEATVINHSPPRKRIILANVVVSSMQRRRKPTNTARTRIPIDPSYQPSTRRQAAKHSFSSSNSPSYFLDFSLMKFNPAIVKNNINTIQKTQDDKDEKTRENAEIAARAILARLQFLSYMLAGPPPAVQIQEVTVDENADENENVDEDENMDEDENVDKENTNEENADEENVDKDEHIDEELNADEEQNGNAAENANANENTDENTNENSDENMVNKNAVDENAVDEGAADGSAVDKNALESVEEYNAREC
ncbi:hypothetical protein EV426DRAFT_579148 [Tirmania nivea]|nr:hypothetical protein EV426DRAFT_579148 [Tirmania nivea]